MIATRFRNLAHLGDGCLNTIAGGLYVRADPQQ